VLVIYEIHHGAVTTWVEHSVKLRGTIGNVAQFDSVLPHRFVIFEEVLAHGVILEYFYGGWIKRRFAAQGSGINKLGAGFQDLVGMS
jgi:hypothetical protein